MLGYLTCVMLVVSVSGQLCGQTPITPDLGEKAAFIAGGKEVRPHSWPWQVSLGKAGYHNCGGSIINKRWILSAAHCFDNDKEDFKVRVGYHRLDNLTGTEKTYKVDKVIVHEDYDLEQLDRDVALLKLDADITFSDTAQPVCLPEQGREWNGESMVATGWGALKIRGKGSPELRQVVLRHIPFSVCSRKDWNGNGVYNYSMICAGYEDGGKDSCQGDSGGPLVLKQSQGYVQAGIVSWGYGCAIPKKPGVYTHLSQFVNWINEKIANN